MITYPYNNYVCDLMATYRICRVNKLNALYFLTQIAISGCNCIINKVFKNKAGKKLALVSEKIYRRQKCLRALKLSQHSALSLFLEHVQHLLPQSFKLSQYLINFRFIRGWVLGPILSNISLTFTPKVIYDKA
jgi:hypothetical protein